MLRKQPARLVALCNLQKPSVFSCDSDKIGIHERGHSWVTSGLWKAGFFEGLASSPSKMFWAPLGWGARSWPCHLVGSLWPVQPPVRPCKVVIQHHRLFTIIHQWFCNILFASFFLRSLRATALLISGSTEISSVCAGLVSCTKLRALKCGTEPAWARVKMCHECQCHRPQELGPCDTMWIMWHPVFRNHHSAAESPQIVSRSEMSETWKMHRHCKARLGLTLVPNMVNLRQVPQIGIKIACRSAQGVSKE